MAKEITIEEILRTAQKNWDMVFLDCQKGIINRNLICAAMGKLNYATKMALAKDKRYLLIKEKK
jgi:hypothetical protein